MPSRRGSHQQQQQQQQASSSITGTLATCYARTFMQEIPPSVQQEAWRLAPNELRRLLALAPRTMLFAHRALSSICHPHLSTVAWRADLSTRLTAAQAEEDLLPWKVNAAAKQQAAIAKTAGSTRRPSREMQAQAHHGSIVPAEPSRAALGTRRFKAMLEALRGDAALSRTAAEMDEELAARAPEVTTVSRSGDTDVIVVSANDLRGVSSSSSSSSGGSKSEDATDKDENNSSRRSSTALRHSEHENDKDVDDFGEEEEEEEEGHSYSADSIPIQDKWMLLSEIHAQVRMSDLPVDVAVRGSAGKGQDQQQQQQQRAPSDQEPEGKTSTLSARELSAGCIAEWRSSPLILSMLRIIFLRLATVPSETALKNSGVSGGVSALKRALSVRFGVDDGGGGGGGGGSASSRGGGASLEADGSVSLNINAAVLPSDFALMTNPEKQRDGTLSRQLSRIFGAATVNDENSDEDAEAAASKKKKQQSDPLLDSYVSVASYILFQQRLFSILFHATADEQVVCAALLDFITDSDYVGGGSLSRMTTDVGKSDNELGAGGVDPVTAAHHMRKSMNSFRKLSTVSVDKIKHDHHAQLSASADASGGGADASLSVTARNQLLLNSVPQMKAAMRAKVLSAACAMTEGHDEPHVLEKDSHHQHQSSSGGAKKLASRPGGAGLSSALATTAEKEQMLIDRANNKNNNNAAGSVFSLTQAEFEDALDATFDNMDAQQQQPQQQKSNQQHHHHNNRPNQVTDRIAAAEAAAAMGAGKKKWSSKKDNAASSSSAHLLHVRDFSKFGVFYEKFAKFMFELCDNWAASHSVDGVAAFLGFIARAAFPAPIDTVWAKNLPLLLRNEMKERMRKLAELQALEEKAGGGGGAGGGSLDAQLDMMERLAEEEAALEAGQSDPSGKRSAARDKADGKNRKKKTDKEKFEALELSAASWKNKGGGGKNRRGKSGGGGGDDDDTMMPGGASSEFDGIALPQIVVHSPSAAEAAAAKSGGGGDGDDDKSKKKKKRKKVTFRFDLDDYGSDEDDDDDAGDDDRVAVVAEKEQRSAEDGGGDDGGDGGDSEKPSAERSNQDADDTAASSAPGGGGDGGSGDTDSGGGKKKPGFSDEEEDPRKLLQEHLRRKRQREKEEAEEAEKERARKALAGEGNEGADSSSSSSYSLAAAAPSSHDPDIEGGNLSTMKTAEDGPEQQQRERHQLPSSSSYSSQKATTAAAAGAAAKLKPTPPSASAAKGRQPPRAQDDPSQAVGGQPMSSRRPLSSERQHPNAGQQQQQQQQQRDRFREKRSWFRGTGDGGAAAMRDFPLQVDPQQPSSAPGARRGQHPHHEGMHPHNALYDIVPHVSPTTDSSFLSGASGVGGGGGQQRRNVVEIATQTQMTIWWRQDDRPCVPQRLVRPFEERKLISLGLPVPPPKRK